MADTFDRFQPRDRGRFGDNEYRDDDQVQKSDLCDFTSWLRNDNPSKKAIAVSVDRETPFAQWVWLPRSKIEYEKTGSVRGTATVRVTLPRSLARETGLMPSQSDDEGQGRLGV